MEGEQHEAPTDKATYCKVKGPLSIEHRGSAFGVMRRHMSLTCCLCSCNSCSVYGLMSIDLEAELGTYVLVVNTGGQGKGVGCSTDGGRAYHGMRRRMRSSAGVSSATKAADVTCEPVEYV